MKCLIEGCEKPQKTRGLCATHYASLHLMVKQERTTWLQLEQFGMALAARRIKKSLAEAHFQKCMKQLKRE